VSYTDLTDNYPVQLQNIVLLMLSITILGCRIHLEPEVNRTLDQINDAVKQVESTEKERNGDCLVRQTVKEIQAGNFKKVTSPFLLVMQTAKQRELLVKYGNTVTLMDAIYKTCKYNFPCFFLTVKTSVGIGQVVATIIPEFETEEMLSQGLQIVKSWTLTWSPSFFVTDKSAVELNAIAQVHSKAVRLLCDFHRVQAQDCWINKNNNGIPEPAQLKAVVSEKFKEQAYVTTGTAYMYLQHVHVHVT